MAQDVGCFAPGLDDAGGRKAAGANRPNEPVKIRAWAKENGYTVSDRGRVSSEVREAYTATH